MSKTRPTIRQLEEILEGPGGAVHLNPDGSVIVVPNVIKEIADERERQISAEGWTPEHDDEHGGGEMANATAAYARRAASQSADGTDDNATTPFRQNPPPWWPWDAHWWKPADPRRNLIKAAALIVAGIERLDRAAQTERSTPAIAG